MKGANEALLLSQNMTSHKQQQSVSSVKKPELRLGQKAASNFDSQSQLIGGGGMGLATKQNSSSSSYNVYQAYS